jgi:hypothetical protein
MLRFTDTRSRTWTIEPNVATLARVRDLAGLDLYRLDEQDSLDRLRTDPYLLVDVLFAAVKPQADAAGMNDEAFASSLGGDVLEAATACLLEAVTDFFPSRKAAVLRKALAKMRQTEDRMMTQIEAEVDRFDPEAVELPEPPGFGG